MRRRMNRRTFLRGSVSAGVGLLVLKNASLARTFAANEKVNVALVGVSGRGGWFVRAMPGISNVVALCDVNKYRAKGVFEKFPDLPKYEDARVMLEEMDKQIDAIVVATPDNTHAVLSAAGIRHGKGVFTEKPLTHDVFESRRLRELTRKHKVATQMGNQGSSGGQFRRMQEVIQAGAIGEIRDVHTWNCNGGTGPGPRVNVESMPVPATLNWNLWLGPAADRPYHTKWMRWLGWRDLGTSMLGNWGSHSTYLAFLSLKVGQLWDAKPDSAPIIRVTGECNAFDENRFPRTETVHWEIPARGNLPPVTFHWYNGPQGHEIRPVLEKIVGRGLDWGDKGKKKWADWAGCLIVGTKGTVYANGHNNGCTILPEKEFAEIARGKKGPAQTLPRSQGHERDWLEAVKGGPAAWSNFDDATRENELLMLGNLATLFRGQALRYDPVACKIVNNADADKALRREYREGWEL